MYVWDRVKLGNNQATLPWSLLAYWEPVCEYVPGSSGTRAPGEKCQIPDRMLLMVGLPTALSVSIQLILESLGACINRQWTDTNLSCLREVYRLSVAGRHHAKKFNIFLVCIWTSTQGAFSLPWNKYPSPKCTLLHTSPTSSKSHIPPPRCEILLSFSKALRWTYCSSEWSKILSFLVHPAILSLVLIKSVASGDDQHLCSFFI